MESDGTINRFEMNRIICADVLDGLRSFPDNVVHLTNCSPPYNVKLPYRNYTDNLPHAEYLKWLESVFKEVFRVTVPGGRCAINIDAVTNRQDDNDQEYIRPIYPELYQRLKQIGWKFKTEICWVKQNVAGKPTAWGSWLSPSNCNIRRNHEYILVFSKDQWVLNGTDSHGQETKTDLKPADFVQWTISTWFIQPETRKLCGHPAPFPEELAKRVIKLFSYPGQTVLDPFNGVGTTSFAAFKWNRNYLGIDNCKEYCDFAEERIQELIVQRNTEGYVEDDPETVCKGWKGKDEKQDVIDLESGYGQP